MIEFILIILVLAIIGYVLWNASISKSDGHKEVQANWRKQVRQALDLSEHVQNGVQTVGLDKQRRRLAVVRQNGEGFWIPLASIRSVELKPTYETIEEGISTTSTNRGSQLSGAAVGATIAGPLGGAVGGLSGKRVTESRSTSENYLSRLELKVRLRSDAMPSFIVDFGDEPEFDPETKTYTGGLFEVERFFEHLEWELEKIAERKERCSADPIETIRVHARPANTEGWWTSTFGG